MALSYVRYTSDGIQDTYPLTFPYLDKGHIKVFVDKSEWNFVVDEQYKRVKLIPVPANNRNITIRRHTPRENPYSTFTGGNVFGQTNVNNNFLWQLYISQEIAEGALSIDFIPDNDINMGGARITNLGAPVNPDDAARYRDLLDFPFQGEKGDKGDKGDEGPVGPQGAQGIQGREGPQGPVGPTPKHEWEGTKLRLQQGDGTWGNFSDLIGPEGPQGPQGVVGPTPAHEWEGTRLRFQQGNGSWGNFQDLIGPQGATGPTGPQGPVGPTPNHEWSGSTLRFQQGDGSWGNYQDLTGPQGPIGERGIQGAVGPQGIQGVRGLQGIEGPIGPRGDKGDKGDDGDSFHIDAIGTYAELPLYDDRPALFTYMATDYQFNSDADVLADTIKTVAGQASYSTRFTSINVGGLVVTIGGATQSPTRYTVSGGTLTFASAPPVSGLDIIVRRIMTDGGSIGALFIKKSATSGDWAVPIPFGRGPEGPKGVQGDRGERGPQGEIGPQGAQGPEGERGPTGNQGPQGIQGLRGPEGPKGVQGDKGLDGSQGPQGEQGLRGPEGPKGVQGDMGLTGPQGPQGDRGPEGQKGVQGDKGIDGQQGPQGPVGPTGPQGPAGNQGATGAQGPRGEAGPVGPRGDQGDRGPNGQAGERGSRAFYEPVSSVSWNQGIVDRFFGPTAEYPYPVPYDLFVQYNESKGYSETRVYRSGVWQTKPVNLVQDFINKVVNGVDATTLKSGSASLVMLATKDVGLMQGHILRSAVFKAHPKAQNFTATAWMDVTLSNMNGVYGLHCELVRARDGRVAAKAYSHIGIVNKPNYRYAQSFTLFNEDSVMTSGEAYYVEFFVATYEGSQPTINSRVPETLRVIAELKMA